MLKQINLLFLIGLLCPSISFAQWTKAERDSLNQLSKIDHSLMMEQLGIDTLRPGPSGNPQTPNAANSDESQATTYTTLPKCLRMENGSKVNSAEEWRQKRRPELVEIFDKEIYGRVPDNVPAIHWKVIETKDTMLGGIPIKERKLSGRFDNTALPELEVSIELIIGTPANVQQAVPLMLEFGFNLPAWLRRRFPAPPDPSWKEQLIRQGWAYGVIVPSSFQADNGAGLTQGIIGLTNKGKPRTSEQWGTLRAWAYGASKAIDYFETDSLVDAKRIGIEGLSRYGKAAIVAMAYDERIAIGFIGSSGAGGTKILRRNFGEQVENLASSAEYHWFAGNFIKYAGSLRANDLPIDAHQLVALCAPRPIYISTGNPKVEGHWVDAKGMFLSGVHATPVYELLDKRGLKQTTYPSPLTNLANGEIAFREHEGGHTTHPNWPYFIQYAERYFEPPTPLKDAFNDAFLIGSALNENIVSGIDKAAQNIVLNHFNTITPENVMKAGSINPEPEVYNFKSADDLVAFGQANNLFIVGHTLIWHNQTPAWFFQDKHGNPNTPKAQKERMHQHIELVASRYSGKVDAWDVVNEVIDNDGSYRPTTWVKGVGDGDELVKLAFKYAAQYAPNTELYYNDFNAWRPAKRDGIARMVRMLQKEGIRIDGIGIQGHWGLNFPKNEYIEAAIDTFASLGVKVMITELDIDVLPLTKEGQIIGSVMSHSQFQLEEFEEFLDPYQNGLPIDISQQLTNRYKELFEIFYRKKDKIDRITFWGVHDGVSWKNGYPIPNRTNYPLLFDRDKNPKSAVNAILRVANK